MNIRFYSIAGIICLLLTSLLFMGQSCQRCTDNDSDEYSIEGGDCGLVDCDDSDAGVNPDADEICDDGLDNNCDGDIDERCAVCNSSEDCEEFSVCIEGICLPEELKMACEESGGNVTTGFCCLSAGNFPDSCLTGACGCAPEYSHSVLICICLDGDCWDTSQNSCVDRDFL